MATIGSCIKIKTMKKVNAIFEGVIFLWVFLIAATIFLSMCLSGMCSPEWVFTNVVLGSLAELIFFVWIVTNIRRGSLEILRQTKNLLIVKALYKRILYLSVIVALYGLLTFSFSSEMFNHFAVISENETNSARIYLLNVLIVAFIIFFWMCIEIHRINKRLRF